MVFIGVAEPVLLGWLLTLKINTFLYVSNGSVLFFISSFFIRSFFIRSFFIRSFFIRFVFYTVHFL